MSSVAVEHWRRLGREAQVRVAQYVGEAFVNQTDMVSQFCKVTSVLGNNSNNNKPSRAVVSASSAPTPISASASSVVTSASAAASSGNESVGNVLSTSNPQQFAASVPPLGRRKSDDDDDNDDNDNDDVDNDDDDDDDVDEGDTKHELSSNNNRFDDDNDSSEARCVRHFVRVIIDWLFADASGPLNNERDTALLAARHVGYGVRSQHFAAWRKLLVEGVQLQHRSSPAWSDALADAYRAHFDARTAGMRAASKQIVKHSPAHACRFLSRRKVVLLHAYWEQLSRDAPRPALTRFFYDALRSGAPPIHAFVGKRARENALRIDAFRQLLGGLVEYICAGAENRSSLRILFESLLGVSSVQYSMALFDATGRAALASCALAAPTMLTQHVVTALQNAFTLLAIQLARVADPAGDDDTSLYHSAQQLLEVTAPASGAVAAPPTRPGALQRKNSVALLGMVWAPRDASGDPLSRLLSRSAALVLNATAPRCVQFPTYRVAEHLLRRAIQLVSDQSAACARFGASALHLARLHADFAVFVRDTRILHAVRVQDFSHTERVAFFLNLYHALVLHIRILRADDEALAPEHFHLFKYRVGKQELSLHAIEHCVLRACSFAPLLTDVAVPTSSSVATATAPTMPQKPKRRKAMRRVRSSSGPRLLANGSAVVDVDTAAAAAAAPSVRQHNNVEDGGDALMHAAKTQTVYAGALSRAEPLITFALSHCARSCPPIRMYRADRLHEMLAHATREYLDMHVVVKLPSDDATAASAAEAAAASTADNNSDDDDRDDEHDDDDDDGGRRARVSGKLDRSVSDRHGALLVPRLLHWYGRDFAATPEALLEWIGAHVGERLRRDLAQLRNASDAQGVRVRYRGWRGSFAFQFSTDEPPASVVAEVASAAANEAEMRRRASLQDDAGSLLSPRALNVLSALDEVGGVGVGGGGGAGGAGGAVARLHHSSDRDVRDSDANSGNSPLRRSVSAAHSPSARRAAGGEVNSLRDAKQQADAELAVYLMTLQAKTDKLGARPRTDALVQAFHRLRTVATEVLNTPAREYAGSPLSAAHDAVLGDMYVELRAIESAAATVSAIVASAVAAVVPSTPSTPARAAAAGGATVPPLHLPSEPSSSSGRRLSRDMSQLLRRSAQSTGHSSPRRRSVTLTDESLALFDESETIDGDGAELESLASLTSAAQRDLLDSLAKLRSVRATLSKAIDEFLRATAREREKQLRLRRKRLRNVGALREAVRQSVRFVCRICERTLRCSGAQFERHSRVCSLGHTLANDSRLSRDERLVKLMALASTLCGVDSDVLRKGSGMLVRSVHAPSPSDERDHTEVLVSRIERIVHAVLVLPYGGAAAAADCARHLADLRALLEEPDVPSELSTLGHCMCELIALKADYLGGKQETRRSGSGVGGFGGALAKAGSGMVSIDDFKMLKPISKGGYGTVFLASKRATGDLYAIKMMKKEDLVHKNVVEQVLAERDIMASSNNPFVVKLFYALETETHLYLVMEFIIGGDCAALLENLGCFEEPMTRVYAAQIVCALEYLHAKAIVHRDLKPDNLLITAQGHLVLTDFGLSSFGADAPIGTPPRRGDDDSSGDDDVVEPQSLRSSLAMLRSTLDMSEDTRWDNLNESDTALSAGAVPPPPRILGTPHYLAPEMILQQPHHFGVDWWALGIIVFEFLSGSTPFEGDTPEAIMRNILHAQIPWSELPTGTSPAAQAFIAALLRRDVDTRLGARGTRAVKRHAFFAEIEWSMLLEAATGFQPLPDSATDTSYFIDHGAASGSEDSDADTDESTPADLPPVATPHALPAHLRHVASAPTSPMASQVSSPAASVIVSPSPPSTPPPSQSPALRPSPLAQHATGPSVGDSPADSPSSKKDRVAALKAGAVQTRARSGSSPPRFKLAHEFQFVNVTSLEQQNARAIKVVVDEGAKATDSQ
jgi:serine/threonine protein kinase